MKRNTLLLLSCLLACLLPGFATGATTSTAPAPLPKDSVYQLPLQLTDARGKSWDWRARRGRPQLVAMFYASCPDMCPLVIDSGKAVEHALAPGERSKLQILYVSMDPVHDTPPVLAGVAARRKLDGSHWTLASPRADDVRSVAGLLGTRFRQLADGQFNHTSALLLLDAEGRIVARTERVDGLADPEFVGAVHRILAQP